MAEYLKLAEVARRLDVSEKTARRYVKSGELPSMFIGNAYRVSEEDLEGYLRDARVQPGDSPPKADARSLAGAWFKARGLDDELALPDHESVSFVAALDSVSKVEDTKDSVDLQRDAAKAFLADHKPSRELRESLEIAVRKHLYWLIDLGKRRKGLLAEQRQGDEATSNDVRFVAVA